MTTPEEMDERLSNVEPCTPWRQNEEYVIPENRLGVVFLGVSCALCTVLLDLFMAATALPTIVAHLGGANNYIWLGNAYLLGSSVMGPLYGKFSDMFGRKNVFFTSIITFLVGSTLCGAAQTTTWLIACQAIQGLGGAGVTQLVIVIISDIVPLKERGFYTGLLGANLGIVSIIGPLAGGTLAQYVSWRWCFFIPLPIGGVAAVVLFIFLNLNPHPSRSFREHLTEFDFIGLTCIILGMVCLLIGFSFAEASWSDPKTIVLVVVGCTILIAGGINEVYTRRSQILPPRLFKTRTTAIILITSFFVGIVETGGVYYLPLYYQILSVSAFKTGISMLPYFIGNASASIISGIVISRTGSYRPIFWAAWSCMIAGWGAMTIFSNNSASNTAKHAGISFIAALGGGCVMEVHTIAIQASMPLKDMATSSSAAVFLRSLGGTVGISLGAVIISSALPAQLAAIPNVDSFHIGSSLGSVIQAIEQISQIEDAASRQAIMDAFARSISMFWLMLAALSGLGLILSLFIRGYSLERKVVRRRKEEIACVEEAVNIPASPSDIKSS